ncbi:SDR family oxidoreductase [Aliiglaciecola lipolytica]|uniref:SDR family oxidoreductase n=1 Tax=Aliiglaciecola lipolytica TaxID=477689 RepID=UPI001C0880BE|nr:SDR family oxidoreductase [Aliiglaciecola lipolytica]MBU2877053.1 SDR family oxidoreductase [Aliiglaciecola lipolytica]
MRRLAIFGASGYLGAHLIDAALSAGMRVTAFVRNIPKEGRARDPRIEYRKVNITCPQSLNTQLLDCDMVVTTVGITRQKEGFSYEDIDYGANLNILREAQKSAIKKFVYIGVYKGTLFTQTELCKAKERFVDELENSGLQHCTVRPTGFFSDMTEIFNMARKGRVYLFGEGHLLLNPIHGRDLADAIIYELLLKPEPLPQNFEVGGPIVYSQNEIAELAFQVLGKKPIITRLPNWCRLVMLYLGKMLLSPKVFGPYEFFLTTIATNMNAPQYGNISLKTFFQNLEHERKGSKVK